MNLKLICIILLLTLIVGCITKEDADKFTNISDNAIKTIANESSKLVDTATSKLNNTDVCVKVNETYHCLSNVSLNLTEYK